MNAPGTTDAHVASPYAAAPARPGRLTLLAAAGLALLVLLAYATSLANGFALDDVHIVQHNPLVHSLDLIRIWSSPYWPDGTELGLYRPLTTTLFAIQWAIGGGDPLLFHVVSMALHAAVCVFVFLLVRRLLPDGDGELVGALFGAAVFALHPVHVEAVANVVGQAELTAAAAVLAACLVHVARPALAVGARRLLVLLVLYAAALSAKEHAIVLPGLLLALDLAGRRPRGRRALAEHARAVALPMLALLAVAGVFLAARAAVLGSVLGAAPNPAYGFLEGELRIWNALRAWPVFFRLLLAPVQLSVDYSPAVIPVATGLDPMTLIGALLLIGTMVAATRITSSTVGLAAAWLLISIVPVSNLLFPIGVLVAERTLYLPSVAVAVGAGVIGAHYLSRQEPARPVTLSFAAIVLVALGVRTAVRNPVWQSTETVTASLVRDNPLSYRAQWTLAAAAARAGDRVSAAGHYDIATTIYPHDPALLLEYADFQLEAGRVREGLQLLQQVRALVPAHVPARLASAYVFNRIAEPDSALPLLRALHAERAADGVEAELGRALDQLGRHTAAAEAWRAAAVLGGEGAWTHHARAARSLAMDGDRARANDALTMARQSAGDDIRAAAVLDTLARLIASRCYEDESCATDPLRQRGG